MGRRVQTGGRRVTRLKAHVQLVFRKAIQLFRVAFVSVIAATLPIAALKVAIYARYSSDNQEAGAKQRGA